MAQHRRETVMTTLKAAITGLTTVGANVFRQREYDQPVTVLPSYNLQQGDEEVLTGDEDVYSFSDRDLAVVIEMRTRGTSQPETSLNQIDQEAMAAILADRTLGLAWVFDTVEQTTTAVETDVSGDQPVAMFTKLFLIKYRTSGDDPGA